MSKRRCSIFMILIMISTTLLSFTFTGAATKATREEPYTIHFVYHAPKEGNAAEVSKALSAITLKALNMKVDLIPLGWDTYNTKFSAMLAAKEPMDIAFSFSFNRPAFIDAGYFVDASKYTAYTKDIYKILGEDVKTGNVAGQQIGFPVMNARSAPSGIFVRKDIFEALGYKLSDFNVTTDNMASFDQITQMFAKIKKKYPNITPFDGHRIFGENALTYIDGMGDNFGVLQNYGQTTKVTNWYETDQFKKLAQLTRKWVTSGYTSKDIAVSHDDGRAKMATGKCASFFASYIANQAPSVKAATGYDVVIIPVSKRMKDTTNVNALLNSVLYSSKDKVKAFKFLNWAYTSAEFNNILDWGVPGKDWVVKNGFADFPNGVNIKNVNYHEDFGFVYPNQYLTTPWAGSAKDVWDQYKHFDDKDVVSKAYGFVFNPAAVSNEEAQCSAVLAKYEAPICYGVVDPLKEIPQLNKELYSAGLQKIIDEKQKQLNEWLKTKK